MIFKLKYIIALIILLSMITQLTCISTSKIINKIECIKKYNIESSTTEEESTDEDTPIREFEELLYINNSQHLRFLLKYNYLSLSNNVCLHIHTISIQIPSPPPKFYL